METADNEAPATDPTLATVEAWAERKGMTPQFRRDAAGRNLENQLYVGFVAAKGHRNWPVGKEVTEDEFDAAVAEGLGANHR